MRRIYRWLTEEIPFNPWYKTPAPVARWIAIFVWVYGWLFIWTCAIGFCWRVFSGE
jgi:hypothetical protein